MSDQILICSTVPVTIPSITDITNIYVQQNIKFVLIVEKESAFVTIVEQFDWLLENIGPMIILTGKGYPCLNTRMVAKKLKETRSDLNFYGLFDHDPYGIDIARIYKYGSQKTDCGSALLETFHLLGVNCQDISAIHSSQKLPLTPRDMKRIDNLLCLPELSTDRTFIEQLEGMKVNQCKFEIEAMNYENNESLVKEYLKNKLSSL